MEVFANALKANPEFQPHILAIMNATHSAFAPMRTAVLEMLQTPRTAAFELEKTFINGFRQAQPYIGMLTLLFYDVLRSKDLNLHSKYGIVCTTLALLHACRDNPDKFLQYISPLENEFDFLPYFVKMSCANKKLLAPSSLTKMATRITNWLIMNGLSPIRGPTGGTGGSTGPTGGTPPLTQRGFTWSDYYEANPHHKDTDQLDPTFTTVVYGSKWSALDESAHASGKTHTPQKHEFRGFCDQWMKNMYERHMQLQKRNELLQSSAFNAPIVKHEPKVTSQENPREPKLESDMWFM